jgi:hypothetical protein
VPGTGADQTRCGKVAAVRWRDWRAARHPASGGSTDVELVLVYGRPVPRSQLARLAGGVLALVVFLAVFAVGLGAGPSTGGGILAVAELVALGCVVFAGWALPGAVKGLMRARELEHQSGPQLRLSQEGLELRASEGGDVSVFAPWELVERCEFRPAPGGDPRWCVDAPIALPPSLSFAVAWAGMVPPDQVEVRVTELAQTWKTLGAPADRRLLRDALVFGTPIVVDLTRCAGVTVSRLDVAVRTWTFGRCCCDPTALAGDRRGRAEDRPAPLARVWPARRGRRAGRKGERSAGEVVEDGPDGGADR